MRNDSIEVRPVAGALGAEIVNIDLAHELDDETIAAIRRAWLEHLVIFFRDQTLAPERFLKLARRFGEVIDIRSSEASRDFRRSRRWSSWKPRR